MRVSWDEVFAKPVLEFLNVLSYRRDKAAWEQEELKKWQMTH